MGDTSQLTKSGLASPFCTPATYLLIVIFLLLNQTLIFSVGDFFSKNEADMTTFFIFVPWTFALFIPAIMISHNYYKNNTSSVISRFFSGCVMALVALFFTIPFWLTMNYLGQPDNELIMAGYLGCLFIGAAFSAVTVCFSSFIKTPLAAFLISVVVCLLLLLNGEPIILGYLEKIAPLWIPNFISQFSLLTHFSSLCRGLLDVRTIIYLLSFIGFWLFLTTVILEKHKK